MKAFSFLIGFCFLFVASPALAETQPAAGQADAKVLLSSAQRALGQVVRSAQADPALDAGKSESKPFWEAMKQANESLGKAETGLALKDETFFTNLAAAHAQVIQADVALTMNKASSATRTSLNKLMTIVSRLDNSYSKEAASLKGNARLTSAERKQLNDLKRKQRDMMKKLNQVEKNAAKNNKEMKAGIAKIKKEAEKIRKARKNRAGYASSFLAARMMSSWMWGWHWWWGPWGAWCPGWIDIIIIDWDGWLDAVPYDWDLVDAYVDVSDLGLDSLDLSDADFEAADEYLINGDFSLDDGDLREITSHLDYGWAEVESDTGRDIESLYESNFEDVPFDQGFDANTFDDYGMDDFGGDFGGGMDFDW